MSEMTTAEMVAWLKDEDGAGAETTNAIAARLSALDKVAKAAAKMAEWTDDDDVNSNVRPAFDALRAALKEAGYGE
jgi:phage-related minor tail protein